MIAQTLAILLVIGAAVAKPMAGVDPNTVQCDPHGHEFLLLPHFTECSKFFMCAHGKEVEFSCSGGLVFDFELQGCDWEWSATCTLRTVEHEVDEDIEGSGEESGEESGDYEWESFAEPAPKASPMGALATVTGQIRAQRKVISQEAAVQSAEFSAVLDCSRSNVAAKQVPYKGDCQRYWRCLNGLPQSVFCSDGLFFNSQSQQCDFEANVKCEVNHEYELEGEFIVYK